MIRGLLCPSTPKPQRIRTFQNMPALSSLIITVCLLALTACGGSAQQEPQRKVSNKTTPKKQYTSGDVVTQIFQDDEGNMWFTTTDEGVFQYDGQSFKQYTVNDGFCGYDVWDIM